MEVKDWIVEHLPIRNSDLNMEKFVDLLVDNGYIKVVKKVPIKEALKTRFFEIPYDYDEESKIIFARRVFRNFLDNKYQHTESISFKSFQKDAELIEIEASELGLFSETTDGDYYSNILVSRFDSKEKIGMLKVNQIKENLKKRKLEIKGRKAELIDRLFDSIQEDSNKKQKLEEKAMDEEDKGKEEKEENTPTIENNNKGNNDPPHHHYPEQFDYIFNFVDRKDSIGWGRACRECYSDFETPYDAIAQCILRRCCSPKCAYENVDSLTDEMLFDGHDFYHTLMTCTYNITFVDQKYVDQMKVGMIWGTTAY